MTQVIIHALNTLISTEGLTITFNIYLGEEGYEDIAVQHVSQDHPQSFQIHTREGVFNISSSTVTPFVIHRY